MRRIAGGRGGLGRFRLKNKYRFGNPSLEPKVFQFQQAPSGMSSLRGHAGEHGIYD